MLQVVKQQIENGRDGGTGVSLCYFFDRGHIDTHGPREMLLSCCDTYRNGSKISLVVFEISCIWHYRPFTSLETVNSVLICKAGGCLFCAFVSSWFSTRILRWRSTKLIRSFCFYKGTWRFRRELVIGRILFITANNGAVTLPVGNFKCLTMLRGMLMWNIPFPKGHLIFPFSPLYYFIDTRIENKTFQEKSNWTSSSLKRTLIQALGECSRAVGKLKENIQVF